MRIMRRLGWRVGIAVVYVVLMSINPVGVGAQTETPPPTATLTPSATATMTGVPGGFMETQVVGTSPANFNCPVGDPIGWMTVTPDALWLMGCGQCVNGSGQWGTSTDVPEATVTGTPPTPTATDEPVSSEVFVDYFTGVVEELELHVPDVDKSGDGWFEAQGDWETDGVGNAWMNLPGVGDQVYRTAVFDGGATSVDMLLNAKRGENNARIGQSFHFQDAQNYGMWYAFSIGLALGYVENGSFQLMYFTTDFNWGIDTWREARTLVQGETISVWVDGDLKITGSVPYYLSETRYGLINWVNSGAPDTTGAFYDWVAVNPVIVPTATPGPTATGTPVNSYCDMVHDVAEEEPAFEWGGVVYGSSECIDIGPYSASLFGFEWGIPHVAHICFQSVSFGSVYVFGVAILVDIILLAMAAVTVVRLLT